MCVEWIIVMSEWAIVMEVIDTTINYCFVTMSNCDAKIDDCDATTGDCDVTMGDWNTTGESDGMLKQSIIRLIINRKFNLSYVQRKNDSFHIIVDLKSLGLGLLIKPQFGLCELLNFI